MTTESPTAPNVWTKKQTFRFKLEATIRVIAPSPTVQLGFNTGREILLPEEAIALANALDSVSVALETENKEETVSVPLRRTPNTTVRSSNLLQTITVSFRDHKTFTTDEAHELADILREAAERAEALKKTPEESA